MEGKGDYRNTITILSPQYYYNTVTAIQLHVGNVWVLCLTTGSMRRRKEKCQTAY